MIPEFKVWIKEYDCFADCIEAIGYETLEIDLCWGIEESGTLRFDEVVFLRSTGIKDKNGKEIFEGDLITDTGVFNSIVKYGKWVYEEDFGAKSKSVGFYLDKSYEDSPWYENLNYDYISSKYEVVGNIYENEDKVGYGDE